MNTRQTPPRILLRLPPSMRNFSDVTAIASRHTIVFGDRFPFRYFADTYGLDYYAAFPGCSSESEASAKNPFFFN